MKMIETQVKVGNVELYACATSSLTGSGASVTYHVSYSFGLRGSAAVVQVHTPEQDRHQEMLDQALGQALRQATGAELQVDRSLC